MQRRSIYVEIKLEWQAWNQAGSELGGARSGGRKP